MTTKIKQQRIGWVDTVRGIAIFNVLISHQGLSIPLFTQFYAPFYMPVFFIVSGYLFKFQTIGKNLHHIIKGLLFPYILFAFVANCAAPVFLRNIQAGTTVDYLLGIADRVLSGNIFWFITCLIVVQIVYTLLCGLFRKQKKDIWKLILFIVGLLSIYLIQRYEKGWLPWHIDTACFAIGLFTIGDLLKKVNIAKISQSKTWKMSSWLVLLLYIVSTLCFNWEKFGVDINVNCNIFHNTSLCLLLILLGSSAIILFSICNNIGSYVKRLGANTLVIYCMHGFWGLGLSSFIFRLMNIDSWCPSQYVKCLLVAMVASLILLCISYIINRYFPFLLGKFNALGKKQHRV